MAHKISYDRIKLNNFEKSLPFELTKSQIKVVDEILKDLEKEIPMNRLLEGDVGSGKTVVAAIAIYATYLSNKKSIIMAPTQVLAQQHFKTLSNLFKNYKIKIGLFTSTNKSKGDFDVYVGTHTLLGKSVEMDNVSLIVIDEQHKFGVEQRNLLTKKSGTPHVLTMTATPIPQTVALTFFGDVELSTLTESPMNRQKITTWVIIEEKREKGFNWIHDKIINEKIQAFVVCPLIAESETQTLTDVKAATNEYEKIKNKFKDLNIGLLHGKLKTKDKDEVIDKFRKGEIDILVTTPVVEVGIDIPNATIMVIEGADRFGLASLHQLRGRVGRGELKSYCLLMTESTSEKTQIRLTAMTKNLSGFELSELDLKMRGPGEIYGARQSGIPELKIADWSNVEMIQRARKVAEDLINGL